MEKNEIYFQKLEKALKKNLKKRKNITAETSNESVMHDIQKPITLEDLTNPDNKK